MDFKKVFGKFDDSNTFVRTTVPPKITSAQKAALNRRGNVLFNSGDTEGARRIFETTGYSDGISRVGDRYKAEGRPLDALQMYWMAPDRTKCEPLFMSLAEIVRGMLDEKEVPGDE
jgi:hypothetical protein